MLDVESGHTDIALLEGNAASEAPTVYQDRIYNDAAMFSYALYDTTKPVKTFTLGQFLDNEAGGQIGTVTVFAYCFSTNDNARVLFHDGAGTCHLPNNTTVPCPTVPETRGQKTGN
jgi:hypothetical protein